MHESRDFSRRARQLRAGASAGARDPGLHFNRANTLNELRRFDEALAEYDPRASTEPGAPGAQRNRGILKLLLGDYAGGLQDYEARRPPAKRAPQAAPVRCAGVDRRAAEGQIAAGHRRPPAWATRSTWRAT
jgi:tetratricopeptide (TPR) repeat protein